MIYFMNSQIQNKEKETDNNLFPQRIWIQYLFIALTMFWSVTFITNLFSDSFFLLSSYFLSAFCWAFVSFALEKSYRNKVKTFKETISKTDVKNTFDFKNYQKY